MWALLGMCLQDIDWYEWQSLFMSAFKWDWAS
jgi:hypothetical protein